MTEEVKKEAPKEAPKEEKKEGPKGDFIAVTSDGKEIKTNHEVMALSGFIKEYYTKIGKPEDKISLPKVNGVALAKIIEFHEYYKGKPIPKIEKPLKSNKLPDVLKDEWARKYIDIPLKELCELLGAAAFLKLEDLKQLAGAVIATKLYGKKRDEIRAEFKIDSELTPAQDAQLEKFFLWADQLWP